MNRYPRVAPLARIHPGRIDIPVDEWWTPDLLGANAIVAWYDIQSDNSYDNEGDGVKVWRDKSGNNNDLYQDDHRRQPDWVEHSFSPSKEGVVFDGVSDRLAGTTLTVAQPFTVVQIIKTGASQQNQAAIFGGPAQDAVVYVSNEYAAGNFALKAGNQPTNVADSGVKAQPYTTYIVVSQFDGNNSSIAINGVKTSMPGVGTFGITNGPNV